MFQDRKDAGERLARALESYRGTPGLLVLAIPRGGTEIGYEIARYLEADFDLLICRKLPYPFNPESGFGAIAEDGTIYINPRASIPLNEAEVLEIIRQQQEEIRRRIQVLRGGRPLPPLEGRTVILTDDGIAMGSTMHAAVEMCRKAGAARIVVAVPVAGPYAVAEFSRLADDLVVLESPPDFHAVAQVYRNWYDVSDEEVLAIMERWRREHGR
ncbi:phosphoribosyltransferase [Nitratifractor sp.]|uniref:phosphoribosyltransferase n=1 Tax=Nitratifractor sp. TaxID=2268144 RepID=UPI0025CE8BA1|nr:phosphoribosyltransferase [Nitratifractor sp.]